VSPEGRQQQQESAAAAAEPETLESETDLEEARAQAAAAEAALVRRARRRRGGACSKSSYSRWQLTMERCLCVTTWNCWEDARCWRDEHPAASGVQEANDEEMSNS
jgi:hypothetical protein